MRTSKRTLAGVAAGALGLALIPFVGATSANAETAAGAATPVRAGTYGTIPMAQIAFDASTLTSLTDDDTLYGYLLTATGSMYVDDSAGLPASPASTDDSMALGRTETFNETGGVDNNFFGATSTDDSFFTVAVTTAGRYVGGLGNGTDTVTFDFTTVGNPASMTLTPATQTVNVGAQATLTVTLKDASGNTTQPNVLDTIGLTDNSDDTIVGVSGGSTLISQIAASAFADGTGDFYLNTTGNAAGTTTVTATPQGTLVALGVTAQTATVTKSGSVIDDDSAINVYATAPANANQVPTVASGNSANRAIAVPAGTTTVTLAIDDTTGNLPGSTLRFKAQLGGLGAAGTVNGVSTAVTSLYVEATTDASRKASLTFTLGANALLTGATLTVTQVDVRNGSLGGSGTVITQETPVVYANDVTVSPKGNVVAQLGQSTTVTVTVDDSFGTPQAGWTVNAFRTSISGALLSTATTAADGSAQVTVSPLATVVNNGTETYVFTATSPLGTSAAGLDNLVVTYTTSGAITSMTVSASGTGATAFSNAAPTITIAPLAFVPSNGTVSTAGNGAYTIATGLQSTAPTAGGSYVTFTPDTNPGNSITVTVPEGVKVASTAPSGVSRAEWSGGAQSVTVADNTPVYVWATETGEHDITFTSGGITLTGKMKALNTSADAYNIALTPTSQNVAKGAIGSATLTVTDVFGNPVQTALDDTGAVALVATGELLLAGFNTNLVAATGVDGTVRVAFIAGNASGEGSITATPFDATSASKTPAWTPTYIPPVGAPAPALTSVAEVKVGSGPDTASIVIEGSRANRAIIVDGSTSGIAAGTTVRPWIKFPGETQYTQGAASRQIVAVGDLGAGEFTWTRQTSKKTYVYFRTEDGTSQSLRVIIPGR